MIGTDRVRFEHMTSDELRQSFLVEDLFVDGEVRLLHWEAERTILGGAVPTTRPLALAAPPGIKAASFNERRELGVVNVGGAGAVTVDGQRFEMRPRDLVYVGRGAREVTFASDHAGAPAHFYLVSHPAHAVHPTRRVTPEEAQTAKIGSGANASARTLRRYVHAQGATSCQLVMGVTDLDVGSVWNTVPPHTHVRRTEVYLYFDLDPGAVAFHFMGPAQGTRNLVVRDLQAVLSPPWSVHFGAATSRYAFVWSMGGENQEFEDMQTVSLDQLR